VAEVDAPGRMWPSSQKPKVSYLGLLTLLEILIDTDMFWPVRCLVRTQFDEVSSICGGEESAEGHQQHPSPLNPAWRLHFSSRLHDSSHCALSQVVLGVMKSAANKDHETEYVLAPHRRCTALRHCKIIAPGETSSTELI